MKKIAVYEYLRFVKFKKNREIMFDSIKELSEGNDIRNPLVEEFIKELRKILK